jgi:hypothetical protein
MPLGDAIGEVIGAIGRYAGRFFGEFLFETGMKGTGYVLLKLLLFGRTESLDPDSLWCAVAGILFWFLIFIAVYRQLTGC